jgi:hypothetical protein
MFAWAGMNSADFGFQDWYARKRGDLKKFKRVDEGQNKAE